MIRLLVRSSCTAFLTVIFQSCEDEPVENQSNPVQPPIIIEPEVFPDLGHDGPYIHGNVYFGREDYIEYHAGNLPIIYLHLTVVKSHLMKYLTVPMERWLRMTIPTS